jgi:hypothetical protein
VDIHPTEPWVLTSLYSGHVVIWNYTTQSAVKSFEVTELPIRAGKFIPRKQWIVTGSDDMMIRAYNINTQERVTEVHGALAAAAHLCPGERGRRVAPPTPPPRTPQPWSWQRGVVEQEAVKACVVHVGVGEVWGSCPPVPPRFPFPPLAVASRDPGIVTWKCA